MAYKNPLYDLADAYYDLLNNVISVDVFKDQIPTDRAINCVLIRQEGLTTEKNKQLFLTTPIVIIDIITFFNAAINSKACNDIDEEINELIFPTENTHSISIPDHHISTVKLQTSNDIREDGVYRRILRYEHLINQ